ncbi:MAG: hypothetical protein WDN69_02210 [Aliidongia sp.]
MKWTIIVVPGPPGPAGSECCHTPTSGLCWAAAVPMLARQQQARRSGAFASDHQCI